MQEEVPAGGREQLSAEHCSGLCLGLMPLHRTPRRALPAFLAAESVWQAPWAARMAFWGSRRLCCGEELLARLGLAR